MTPIGKYHTHADYSKGKTVSDGKGGTKDVRTERTSDPATGMFSGDQFSNVDYARGMQNLSSFPNWTEYLGTPSGDLKKLSGRVERTIGHAERPFSFLPPEKQKEMLDILVRVQIRYPQ